MSKLFNDPDDRLGNAIPGLDRMDFKVLLMLHIHDPTPEDQHQVAHVIVR